MSQNVFLLGLLLEHLLFLFNLQLLLLLLKGCLLCLFGPLHPLKQVFLSLLLLLLSLLFHHSETLLFVKQLHLIKSDLHYSLHLLNHSFSDY
jgi:hypothetical protein